jgi:hypothetical protein
MPAQVMIAMAACVIVGSMRVRTPRDDDFAVLAAITNHYIATTAVHFAYEAIAEAELRGQWQRDREQARAVARGRVLAEAVRDRRRGPARRLTRPPPARHRATSGPARCGIPAA